MLGVAEGLGQPLREVQLEWLRTFGGVGRGSTGGLEEGVQGDRLHLEAPAAGIGQHLVAEGGGLLGRGFDLPQAAVGDRWPVPRLTGEIGIADDHGEKVVEVVGHAARERAEALQVADLAVFCLERPSGFHAVSGLGKIHDRDEHARPVRFVARFDLQPQVEAAESFVAAIGQKVAGEFRFLVPQGPESLLEHRAERFLTEGFQGLVRSVPAGGKQASRRPVCRDDLDGPGEFTESGGVHGVAGTVATLVQPTLQTGPILLPKGKWSFVEEAFELSLSDSRGVFGLFQMGRPRVMGAEGVDQAGRNCNRRRELEAALEQGFGKPGSRVRSGKEVVQQGADKQAPSELHPPVSQAHDEAISDRRRDQARNVDHDFAGRRVG